MSVHKHGDGWQVKYRNENGQQRSGGTFKRKGDADATDAEIKRRRRLGPRLTRALVDRPGQTTLDQFVRKEFREYMAGRPRKTREQYQWALENHLGELVPLPLYALDVPTLAAHQAMLLENGRSAHTVRTVITLLGGVLQLATEYGLMPNNANPVRSLRKVPADPKDDVEPLNPFELEQVIAALTGRGRIIAVLGGQLGLSPIEIRQIPWGAWNDDKLTIPAAKTKRQRARTRVIDVPQITASELRRWRLESGAGQRLRDPRPIIGEITVCAFKQWGTRTLKPIMQQIAGIPGSAYTLRHSHASALHYCGYTPAAAAKRMGHSVSMHWAHYARVVEALERQPHYDNLDALLTAARAGVPITFPSALEK